MPKVKAIFDADILIHLVKTGAVDIAIDVIDTIYISKYVYENEIKNTTPEGKKIQKLKNSGDIQILDYDKLTEAQKYVYRDTYNLLKSKDVGTEHDDNVINEGERVTASLAKASNIYYYMSDDNRAAPHIHSLANVNVVNYCHILFLYLYTNNYIRNKEEKQKLIDCYNRYIKLYDPDKIPRILRDVKTNEVMDFTKMMGICFMDFGIGQSNERNNLTILAENIKKNKEMKNAVNE